MLVSCCWSTWMPLAVVMVAQRVVTSLGPSSSHQPRLPLPLALPWTRPWTQPWTQPVALPLPAAAPPNKILPLFPRLRRSGPTPRPDFEMANKPMFSILNLEPNLVPNSVSDLITRELLGQPQLVEFGPQLGQPQLGQQFGVDVAVTDVVPFPLGEC